MKQLAKKISTLTPLEVLYNHKVRVYALAKKISTLTPLEAAKKLKSLYSHKGRVYALEILVDLQDIDRNRHGSNDDWWNEMMHEAGEDISDLF